MNVRFINEHNKIVNEPNEIMVVHDILSQKTLQSCTQNDNRNHPPSNHCICSSLKPALKLCDQTSSLSQYSCDCCQAQHKQYLCDSSVCVIVQITPQPLYIPIVQQVTVSSPGHYCIINSIQVTVSSPGLLTVLFPSTG